MLYFIFCVMTYQLLNSLCPLIAKVVTKPGPIPSKLDQVVSNCDHEHEEKEEPSGQQGWIQVPSLTSDASVRDSAGRCSTRILVLRHL